MRIGHGYDVHAFEKNRKLVLAGIVIPYEMGLAGHSDADVLLHSVCDALLGAAALGDIGKLFPDNDDTFKDIDSKILLTKVMEILREKGYNIGNIDVTLIAQEPKISPYIEEMRNSVADCLRVDKDKISIKATTEEGLGFTGKKEGIACHCVCIIE